MLVTIRVSLLPMKTLHLDDQWDTEIIWVLFIICDTKIIKTKKYKIKKYEDTIL